VSVYSLHPLIVDLLFNFNLLNTSTPSDSSSEPFSPQTVSRGEASGGGML
jgi:hypothetical protein